MDTPQNRVQAWLETYADRNMAQGNEYGGEIPPGLPGGITGLRKEIVVKFDVEFSDGTTATTTRSLKYKD